jgi:hypothetical protein
MLAVVSFTTMTLGNANALLDDISHETGVYVVSFWSAREFLTTDGQRNELEVITCIAQ